MTQNKVTCIRISEEILNTAWQSIKFRANKSYGKKPESFSAYLRNLIVEDWSRNRKELTDIINKK